jgi:hypothetical protein
MVISTAIEEHRRFLSEISSRQAKRRRLHDPSSSQADGNGASSAKDRLKNYIPGEETVRNDDMIRYIATGEWSGNQIKGVSIEEECKE